METQWFIFIESLISQRSVEQEDSLVHIAIEGLQFYIFFSEAITFKSYKKKFSQFRKCFVLTNKAVQ